MPIKRLAALVVFSVPLAAIVACNQDNSGTTTMQPETIQSSSGSASVTWSDDSSDPQPAGSIDWKKHWSVAKAEAASSGKLVMIDFYTTWCGPCKMLEKQTFPDSLVVKTAAQLVALKQDAERDGLTLANKYSIRRYPTLLFVDSSGTIKGRIEGFYGPEELALQIQQIIDEHNKSRARS